jgi:hypothetical protein
MMNNSLLENNIRFWADTQPFANWCFDISMNALVCA